MLRVVKVILFLGAIWLLNACSVGQIYSEASIDGAPSRDVDVEHIPDAVPKVEAVTRAGNRSPYTVLGKTYHINFKPSDTYTERGYASWYGTKFHGNNTANGEIYDMYAMTAAHKSLPIPSYVRVTNLENNKSVVVRINDRGPFHDGRIVDLSYVAAKKLDMLRKGTAPVKLEILTAGKTYIDTLASDELYLQVGAFKKAASAYRLKKQVASATRHPAQVYHHANSGLYKVVVGPIANERAVPAIQRSLAAVNITQSYVIKRR